MKNQGLGSMGVDSFQVTLDDVIPPTVRASGELDHDGCSVFESILNSAMEKDHHRVDLALKDVTFVDSSGLSVLISAALRGQKAGRRLNIISMSAHLDHMLTLSGFEHLFRIPAVGQPPAPAAAPGLIAEPCLFAVRREKGACRAARDQVYAFARSLGFDQLALDDIRLAVGEAVSNAVRHGAACGENIEVLCDQHAGKLVVKLRYHSAKFDPQAVPTPTYTTAAEGGMGIYFMKLVMDEVRYEFMEGRTELTLEKQLPA
jgi:serine/threonine-protein kinase RsbW